jgi:hypothetical protein
LAPVAPAFRQAEIREKGNGRRSRLRDKLRKIEELFAGTATLGEKAAASEPPDDSDLWAPHPSPLVLRIVELFTQPGAEPHCGPPE